jgi:hypothetical protein
VYGLPLEGVVVDVVGIEISAGGAMMVDNAVRSVDAHRRSLVVLHGTGIMKFHVVGRKNGNNNLGANRKEKHITQRRGIFNYV